MATATVPASHILVGRFFQLYPAEAAGHLDELPLDEVLRLLQAETVAVAVKVFLRLNPDVAARLVGRMSDEYFVRLFDEIDPVRGTAILSRLDEEAARSRLALLPKNVAKEYEEIMSYPPDSAGALMDTRVVTFKPDETVEQVLARIRTVDDRRIIDICVVDEEGRLEGVVPLQTVAIAQPSQRVQELIRKEPITVNMLDTREDIVTLLEKRQLASLPVVDLEKRLLGVIRHDALIAAAQHEASEDLQAMFGAGREERALSKVSFAIRKRLPWLQINLGTAFLAALVVGLFEDTIARFTALAVFLPVVAGQSGNTGSQALAVTMRGLALREIRTRHWFAVMRKEVMAGFINGVVIALTTALVVYFWMSSAGLAAIIAMAMVASMVIAGLSGALIPMILKAFGQDPAQSSSIVLTTVTDVVGFMSFLGLAKLLAVTFQLG